jgi:hypothetical protein
MILDRQITVGPMQWFHGRFSHIAHIASPLTACLLPSSLHQNNNADDVDRQGQHSQHSQWFHVLLRDSAGYVAGMTLIRRIR